MKVLHLVLISLLLSAAPANSAPTLIQKPELGDRGITVIEAKAEAANLAVLIKRDPSNLKLRRYYCEKLLKAGLSSEAAQQMQAIVALGQRSPEDFCLLADTYRFSGNYCSAILNYQEALGIVPGYAQARAGMALCYMQAGCPKIAKKVCREGLSGTSNLTDRRVLISALKSAQEAELSPRASSLPTPTPAHM